MGKAEKRGREAPDAGKSKWQKSFSKSEADRPKTPLFDEGSEVVTFKGFETPEPVPGKDEWVIAQFEGEDCGDRGILFCMSNKALAMSLPRLKSLIMAIIGCESVEEYDEFDPDGSFFSAMLGYKNAKSKLAAEYIGSAQVEVVTSKGNETSSGDFFRNHKFKSVEASDEDEAPESEAPDSEERPARKGKKGSRK